MTALIRWSANVCCKVGESGDVARHFGERAVVVVLEDLRQPGAVRGPDREATTFRPLQSLHHPGPDEPPCPATSTAAPLLMLPTPSGSKVAVE